MPIKDIKTETINDKILTYRELRSTSRSGSENGKKSKGGELHG